MGNGGPIRIRLPRQLGYKSVKVHHPPHSHRRREEVRQRSGLRVSGKRLCLVCRHLTVPSIAPYLCSISLDCRDGQRTTNSDCRIAALHSVPTGRRLGARALSKHLRPIDPHFRICGRALTVECAPGDNLTVHHALHLAQPSDVLIVGGSSNGDAALWGELMSISAQSKSVAGTIIDGPVRDPLEIQILGYPVFCRRFNPRRATKESYGRINVPVRIGALSICPTDIVLADANGIAGIPRARVHEAIELASEVVRKENKVKGRDPRRAHHIRDFQPGEPRSGPPTTDCEKQNKRELCELEDCPREPYLLSIAPGGNPSRVLWLVNRSVLNSARPLGVPAKMSPESFPVITEIPFEGSPSFVVKLRHVPLRKRLAPRVVPTRVVSGSARWRVATWIARRRSEP